MLILAAAALMLFQGEAHAWYGPICYSDHTTQLTLTIPSISGENPGDLKVDFDDNDGKVKLGGVRASPSVKNAHEVLLVRDPDSQNGIFAVVVTSPRSTTGYKFELEFRKDASECTGAIIKATDRAGGGLLARAAPASGGITLAAAHIRPRAARPRSKPSPSPIDESGAAPVEVVNLDGGAEAAKPADAGDAKPLPTPSAGSEAPTAREAEPAQTQQAGEAPKAEPESRDSGSEAPAVASPDAGVTGIAVPAQ